MIKSSNWHATDSISVTEQIPPRSEIPPEEKWNVEALFPSLEAWEKEFSEVIKQKTPPFWPNLVAFRGKLGESPTTLREGLDFFFSLSQKLEMLYTYAHLKHDEEITDESYKRAFQKVSALLADFHKESSWIEPELLALPGSVLEKALVSAELKTYRFYLERILWMRPHMLTADKEELLAMATKPLQTPPKTFSSLNNADLKFGMIDDQNGVKHPLTHGLYHLYLRSRDRTLRQNAFRALHNKFAEFENTLAELIYGETLSHAFFAQARKFSSSLEAALYPKKIPISVYQSLIKAVREKLPSLHRYIALRKKILNVSELHFFDLYVPLVPNVEIKMSYKEAEEAVIACVAPLGEEYQAALRKGLQENRWVDRYENFNKRSGAYSSGCYGSFPYILMNYKGILRDVFTLAHEAGHSMQTWLSNQNQPFHYSHYPIFVAEVASTFNEALLTNYLLQHTSKPEERLFFINEKIEEIRATLFRQTMFAEFELKIHELVEANIPLTPALMKEIYTELNRDYFGPAITMDEEISIEWARIPHFYYNFYVYQYATGISAAITLAEQILAGDETARNNYLNFLKSGDSLYPIDLLKLAGVDLTTPAPIHAAIKKFDTLLTDFERST